MIHSPSEQRSIDRRGSAGVVETRFADLPPLPLESGAVLAPLRVAYETYGDLSARKDNAILICHALSGDAHAAGWSAEADAPATVDGVGADERGMQVGGLGWWDNLIGPGKAFDTEQYYVICANLIGSCRGSTGPVSINPRSGRPYGTDFPVVTVADMVRAQHSLLAALGIERLLSVAGGSLGGMQALEWSIAFPEAVRSSILTASTARLGAQGVALNAIARSAIMADPDWQGGHYYETGRTPAAGIGLARMVGHLTYLSAESLQQKFGRRLQRDTGYSYSLTEPDFAVESYLRHQAATFATRFDANSYLYISRALTYFDPARTYGHGSLAEAVRPATASYLLISFTSDWIYPTENSIELEVALRAVGHEVERHEIATPYGHDSFLLEDTTQTPLIADFLDRTYRTSHGDRSRGNLDSQTGEAV